MFRTGRIGSNRRNEGVWQPFDKYSRVENFPNGSEAAVELKTDGTRNIRARVVSGTKL
jgi:hypothetical protein